MDINTTAEYRIIDDSKIDKLIKSTVYKEITTVKKTFWRTKKTTEYHSDYDDFLKENTSFVSDLSGHGFLFFMDIYVFLKTVKKIDIADPHYLNYGKKEFETREETVMFINYFHAQKIIPKLEALIITEKELIAFNKLSFLGSVLDITPEIIPGQIKQIKELIDALKKIKQGETLVIIGEYNPTNEYGY